MKTSHFEASHFPADLSGEDELGSSRSADTDIGPVAVVGEENAVAAFRAAGLAVFPAEPGPGAAAVVERLVAQGFRVIFFTADLFNSIGQVLEKYRKAAVPCIVALPSGIDDPTVERLKNVVRMAVGADVFGQTPDASRTK